MSALRPPSNGQPPNVDRGYQRVIALWTLISIAIVAVSLRISIRRCIRKKVTWDDYTILIALVRARMLKKSELLITD